MYTNKRLLRAAFILRDFVVRKILTYFNSNSHETIESLILFPFLLILILYFDTNSNTQDKLFTKIKE